MFTGATRGRQHAPPRTYRGAYASLIEALRLGLVEKGEELLQEWVQPYNAIWDWPVFATDVEL